MTSVDYSVTPPMIDRSLVSEEERLAIWALEGSLTQLASYVRDFQAALDLFDMADFLTRQNYMNKTYPLWAGLAMRDGAMTIYHFRHILTNGQMLRDCPGLRQKLDLDALTSARKRFDTEFPRAERIRHSVGHAAEMTTTIADHKANAFSGSMSEPGFVKAENVKGLSIRGGIAGRRYVATHKGEVIGYDLTVRSLSQLAGIASEFFSGFDAVESSFQPGKRRFGFDKV